MSDPLDDLFNTLRQIPYHDMKQKVIDCNVHENGWRWSREKWEKVFQSHGWTQDEYSRVREIEEAESVKFRNKRFLED